MQILQLFAVVICSEEIEVEYPVFLQKFVYNRFLQELEVMGQPYGMGNGINQNSMFADADADEGPLDWVLRGVGELLDHSGGCSCVANMHVPSS
jgi:hypothetical protein